jgi:hypothetical protein
MLTYECPECAAELKRCAVCFQWLHPSEVRGHYGTEVYCRVCTIILINLAPAAPVAYVN